MTPATREKLKVIVGVALAMVPMRFRKAYGEKPTGISEPAKQEIAQRIVAGIDQMFEVEAKPPPPYGPAHHPPLIAKRD